MSEAEHRVALGPEGGARMMARKYIIMVILGVEAPMVT